MNYFNLFNIIKFFVKIKVHEGKKIIMSTMKLLF